MSVHPRFGLGHKGSPPGSTALSQWELAWGVAGGRELVAVKREESICADSLQQPKAKASLRRRLGSEEPDRGSATESLGGRPESDSASRGQKHLSAGQDEEPTKHFLTRGVSLTPKCGQAGWEEGWQGEGRRGDPATLQPNWAPASSLHSTDRQRPGEAALGGCSRFGRCGAVAVRRRCRRCWGCWGYGREPRSKLPAVRSVLPEQSDRGYVGFAEGNSAGRAGA